MNRCLEFEIIESKSQFPLIKQTKMKFTSGVWRIRLNWSNWFHPQSRTIRTTKIWPAWTEFERRWAFVCGRRCNFCVGKGFPKIDFYPQLIGFLGQIDQTATKMSECVTKFIDHGSTQANGRATDRLQDCEPKPMAGQSEVEDEHGGQDWSSHAQRTLSTDDLEQATFEELFSRLKELKGGFVDWLIFVGNLYPTFFSSS